MNLTDSILVLGGTGMVGGAICKQLKADGFTNVSAPNRATLNLMRQADVEKYIADLKPKFIFLAAARVGGILANSTYKGDFILENLTIQTNVISAAHQNSVEGFLFLGSSCIYPKLCPQPIKEEYLLSGHLEPTNEPYAVAKIAGLKLVQFLGEQFGRNYFSLMPTNLYGEGDNFDEKNSHVIPGLIQRMHTAKLNGDKEFVAWGSGNPMREFLHVEDLAKACVHLMKLSKKQKLPTLINVGTGQDVTIRNLVLSIAKEMAFEGEVKFNSNIPDGTPKKCLDIGRILELGWKPEISLEQGLHRTVKYFYSDIQNLRRK